MISHAGEVPKRPKGLVSKTDSGRKSSEGSNPSFSAINENKARTQMRVFFVFGIIEALCGANYHSKANNYLLSIGLTQKQIDQVQAKLSK